MKENIKKWVCWIICGTFFFILFAGFIVQCGQTSMKVADVVFDRPED